LEKALESETPWLAGFINIRNQRWCWQFPMGPRNDPELSRLTWEELSFLRKKRLDDIQAKYDRLRTCEKELHISVNAYGRIRQAEEDRLYWDNRKHEDDLERQIEHLFRKKEQESKTEEPPKGSSKGKEPKVDSGAKEPKDDKKEAAAKVVNAEAVIVRADDTESEAEKAEGAKFPADPTTKDLQKVRDELRRTIKEKAAETKERASGALPKVPKEKEKRNRESGDSSGDERPLRRRKE
jgi:hypothetical protein